MPGLMTDSQNVAKTIKLFIAGDFPRTESGRSYPVSFFNSKATYAHLCLASRKDLRNAITAAQSAQDSWAHKSAYNRGQILYRMAEMLEARKPEFLEIQKDVLGLNLAQGKKQIEMAIESLVHFAGWSDKYQQIIGAVNPVSGPHHNFTTPEPTGTIGLLFDETATLSEVLTEIAATLVSGNAVVVLLTGAPSVMLSSLAEVFSTSDLPKGVVNLLSGTLEELSSQFGSHMELNGLLIGFRADKKTSALVQQIEISGSDNMKRIYRRQDTENSLQKILRFVEFKTVWHPIGN
jgi:acyl-CoA reductase-like NAD-dependent aldehyde dehydrogenase